jgi:hypothetical protein
MTPYRPAHQGGIFSLQKPGSFFLHDIGLFLKSPQKVSGSLLYDCVPTIIADALSEESSLLITSSHGYNLLES